MKKFTQYLNEKNEDDNIEEALNVTQRRKRGLIMRRFKNKMKIGQVRARRRIANKDTLMNRAKRASRKYFFKKFASGKSKDEIGLPMRQSIEKRLERIKPRIDKYAIRLYPQLKKKEMERKKG